ncbi:MAG: 2-phospho-L-lactate guanylyltransferase [Nocardioidaceae bacterium]|nr:2-phospho-L-lactate guanylyltransferase [Nocardioidaceae bacterium]
MSHLPPRSGVWTVIVPVKQTMIAKTRLTGFDELTRRRLAMSFALDTVAAAVGCPEVRRVVVVTNDPSSAEFTTIGADVIPDEPAAGLNPALVHAAHSIRHADPSASIAALSGDLPALRSSDLSAAFGAGASTHWFVSDTVGTGTTMLAVAGSTPFSPAFGHHSSVAHRAAGAEEVGASGLARLRRDVDTEADLWAAVRLGVGRRTREALASSDVERLT